MKVNMSDFMNKQKKRRKLSQKKDAFTKLKKTILFEIEKHRKNKIEDKRIKLDALKLKITAATSSEELETISREYSEDARTQQKKVAT